VTPRLSSLGDGKIVGIAGEREQVVSGNPASICGTLTEPVLSAKFSLELGIPLPVTRGSEVANIRSNLTPIYRVDTACLKCSYSIRITEDATVIQSL